MLFTQGRFFAFFLAVFAVHWSLRSPRLRKFWLLAVSYAFYALCAGRFLALILVLTVGAGFCALRMAKHSERSRRRPWLWAGVGLGLLQLGLFKYHDFLVTSAAAGLAWLGLDVRPHVLAIALPVGISFYTFQTLSYVVDVYRGKLAPPRDPLDFALFVAFFPTLLAGPILRGSELLPQLAEPRSFARHVRARPLLILFLVGFVKKACAADGIALLVEPVFGAPEAYARASAWLAVVLYHLQIYCDFSGYSDMAIACAGLLGYRLSQNFSFPYFARGIGDFWRRWHISLSTWMRDYLYLPLAGKRAGVARRIFALFTTLGLCGLWHGAGWRFVAFGLLHGTYLVAEELWKHARPRSALLGRLLAPLAWPLTSLVVLLSWPVFQIPELATTGHLLANLCGLSAPGTEALPVRAAWFAGGFLLVHWLAYRGVFQRLYRTTPERALGWLFPVLYGLGWAVALAFVAARNAPFIYFQF